MAPAAEWRQVPFQEALQRVNGKPYQVEAAQYRETGEIPVVDQGKSLVAGFSDRHDKRFRVPPGGLIVFGDHTRIVKFVDFDFVVGADGTQLMVGRPGFSTHLLAYVLQYHEVPSTGYNRHFKFLLDQVYFLPSDLGEQEALARALSDVDALLTKLDQLIAKKRDLKQAAMQQLLTGRTRLPGHSEQWSAKLIGSFADVIRGVTYRSDRDLFPYAHLRAVVLLRANNVRDGSINLDEVQFVDESCVVDVQLLRSDDILICMANGSRQLVGKAARLVAQPVERLTFGAFMGCLRIRRGEADARFVAQLLQTLRYRNYVANLLAGSSINNLRPSDVARMEFAMPPLAEQRAIAEVLADMDAELAALEERREKTRQLKQGMMQALLTGRIRLA